MIKLLKKAVRLAEEYPNYPIFFMVNSDEICDNTQYTRHSIDSVKIEVFVEFDELILFDEDAIIERFIDFGLSDEEAAEKYNDESKPAIVIYTTAS